MINVSKNIIIQSEKKINFVKNQVITFRDNTINIISQKILFIIFIFYISVQVSLCDNSVITLTIKNGNNTFINNKFKNYLFQVYINDINMETIETNYNFTEVNNTVKLIFKSKIKNCDQMFFDCNNITEIDFTNFDASEITKLSQTFKNCHQLISINLSNWDVSKVTDINGLFHNCYSITSIELPNFKNSNITAMQNTFLKCQNLKSLDFSRIDTSKVVSMHQMFFYCESLTFLDLSYFDTSSLANCSNMFYGSSSLTSINLSNFNTVKLQDMQGMFNACKKLVSLDLSNFDTSQVTNMKDLFKDCQFLVSLNISNFNTSLVANMSRMFSHCSNLTSLDLTHFDTSKVIDMCKMFSECSLLANLNISNFNTSNVQNMSQMFYKSSKLKYLDLSGFTMDAAIKIDEMFSFANELEYINLNNSTPNEGTSMTNLFQSTSKNLVICTKSDVISHQKISDCNVINCNENWREKQKKLDSNNCYDNCSITSNKYNYLSKCVSSCPGSTYIIDDLFKCVDICPISTYVIDNKCEKCHSDCKICEGPFNEANANCTSCISQDKYLDNGNCISNDKNLDTTNDIDISTAKEEESEIIPNIPTDSLTNIIINAEPIEINNHDNYINIASIYNTTNNTLIYNIIKENLIPSFNPKNDFEIISEAVEDVVFQITTSKNQLKALYNNSLNNYNLSILDISNCESILIEKYNLSKNDSLILLKKEKKSNKASEKEIQIEIYEPYNKTKLNLSYCENININIYTKTELSEEIKYSYEQLKKLGFDMFNLNDPFYQDICIEYTSYGNTDMILSDRINYIYNNDDTKCQPNCKLSKFSTESEYLNCSCTINEEVNNMNQKFNSKKIYESFFDVLKYSNYKVIKCYNLVFTKFLLTKSIGGITVFSFNLIYLGCFVIFLFKGINPLKDKLKLKIENKSINNDLDKNKDIIIINDNIAINKDDNKYSNLFNPPKRKSLNQNFKSSNISNEIRNSINSENMAKIKKKKRNPKKNVATKILTLDSSKKRHSNFNDNSNNKIKDLVVSKFTKDKILPDKKSINKEIIETKTELDNFELNELDFNEAIKLDKRTFIQIYWGILKREHIILFTFFTFDDYNLIYIKLVRFIFLLISDMAMNVFFFSDESMHKLYIDYGKYDFVQQIPQILYSTIISKLIEIILCYLSLTDKPIYQIKNLALNNSSSKMNFVYKGIKIKLIIFFVFTFMFIIFFWYIVSAFCSVYKNTQTAFIKDWIFSFLLGILLPFIIYLIPSALRVGALKLHNCKGSFFIYKLSEIIPIF